MLPLGNQDKRLTHRCSSMTFCDSEICSESGKSRREKLQETESLALDPVDRAPSGNETKNKCDTAARRRVSISGGLATATSSGKPCTARNFHSNKCKSILFLFSLLSQLLFAWGAITYSYVESDLCGSVNGRHELGTKAACEAAAVSLGMYDTKAYVQSSSIRPPGCWKFPGNNPSNPNTGSLYFNPLTTSATKCGAAISPNPAATCLCATGPICSETDSTTSNSAECICGGAACTLVTGLYCDSSTSTCSRGSACSETDGSVANSDACPCGTSYCYASVGLYCISSLNFCGKTCSLGEYRSAGTNGVCT